MKKIIAILLAVGLLALPLPLGVVSVSATTNEMLTYTVSDGQAIITDCDESVSGKLVIPDTIEGYPVTVIGEFAFDECDAMTSVTIPDSVILVGVCAFFGCSNLEEVTIGAGVSAIGGFAFQDCDSLTSIVVPDTVVTIGENAFACCDNLTDVLVGDGVTAIGEAAFWKCESLTEVTLGNSLTAIGDLLFDSCRNLVSVNVPESVTVIGESAFSGCWSLEFVEIPDSVISIGDNAFQDCDALTAVTIPNGVKTIGNSVFSYCSNLRAVVIPDSVTAIGENAFSDCWSLTAIAIPEGVTSIGEGAFSRCYGLATLTLPKSVATIGQWAFSDCENLKNVYYAGAKAQSAAIYMAQNNAELRKAAWHYGCRAECAHLWESGVCSLCGENSPTRVDIVEQPISGFARKGEKVSVTVEAEGDGLTYVWRVKNAGSSKYSASSITSSTYRATMSDKVKNRRVFCYVYDRYGNRVKSQSVLLKEAVSVVVQPQDVLAAEGEQVSVKAIASGDGLSYQWYERKTGSNLYYTSPVKTATYTMVMSDEMHMRRLYCVIVDKYGNVAVTKEICLYKEETE